MTQYGPANITPPLADYEGEKHYMLRIGTDLAESDGQWRWSFFIRRQDLQEFKDSIPDMQDCADDKMRQLELVNELTWPHHAVRLHLYITGYAEIYLPETANNAEITYLGSEAYQEIKPITWNLGKLKLAEDDDDRPMRADPMTAEQALHHAIHHLCIPHKHGVDITDENLMPPASPIIKAFPPAVQAFPVQPRVYFPTQDFGMGS